MGLVRMLPMPDQLLLDGRSLTPQTLVRAARGATHVALSRDGIERMKASRALIDDAVASGKPVYGVTRGLGARATETWIRRRLADFSYSTIRGRASATAIRCPTPWSGRECWFD